MHRAELLTEIQGMRSCSWVIKDLSRSVEQVLKKISLLTILASDQVLGDLAVLPSTN